MLRGLSTVGKKVCQVNSRHVRSAVSTSRKFSSIIDSKERGDESRYFREEEERKKAVIRANFEKVLAQSDGSEMKAEILELLEQKPEEKKGLIARLGLDDWKFALPVGMILAIPALGNEILVLNAETQLLAVFILALSTLYTQGGSMIAKSLDDYADNIHKTLKKVDDSVLSEYQSSIVENKKLLTLANDYKSLYQVLDDLSVAQADVLNYSAEHKYRDAIAKKLDSLVAIEDSVTTAIHQKMVASVTADVVNQFKDKKIKDAALDQAIAVLAGGASAKLGKDIVGGVFLTSLKTYKENFATKSPELNEIVAGLQRDVAALTVAPEVEGTGGNVYASHPILK